MSKKNIFLYFLSTAFIFALVMWLPSPSKALQLTQALQKTDHLTQNASHTARTREAQLAKLQDRANTMIAIRLASLQKLKIRIQNATLLSSTDQKSLLSDIASTASSLTSLQTKIDADSNLSTAREDAKSIVTAYKIYIFFEPKIRLLAIIDSMQTATASVASLTNRVQVLLITLQGQGKNVNIAQTALNDIATQLAAINTLLATDKTFLENISVATLHPQSVFTQVRKNLAMVREDIAKIRQDFAVIRSNLHTVIQTPTATSSAK